MYSSNQTLRHINTNRLVALCPCSDTSQWNWEIGSNEGKTRLIDETGEIFFDYINNYTHIEDWFGRAVCYTKEKSESRFVNTTLKQYLVSEYKRKIERKKALNEWFEKTQKFLKTEKHLTNWYCDGDRCLVFRKFFMRKVKAKPLVKKYNKYSNTFVPDSYIFSMHRKKFLIKEDIHLIK